MAAASASWSGVNGACPPNVVESNSDNVSAQSALWTFIGLASYLYPEQFPKGL